MPIVDSSMLDKNKRSPTMYSLWSSTQHGILDIMLHPSSVGQILSSRTSLLIPWICLGILIYTGTFISLSVTSAFEIASFNSIAPPSEQLSSTNNIESIIIIAGKVFYVLFPLLTAWFGWLASMTIHTDWKKVILYKRMLSLVLYSEIIYGVGYLCTNILIALSGDVHASLSLGLLALQLGGEPSSGLYALTSRIEVFAIWQFVALVCGLQSLNAYTRAVAYRIAFSIVWLPTIMGVLLRELF